MKKTLLFMTLVAVGISTMWADDYTYPYLIFSASDGTQTTVSVSALEITFADGQLVAKNGDGTTTLTLADLATMTFAETATVSPVTPEKQGCGLAIADEAADITAVLGEEFTIPTIENPNALTLVWTSSDESVATVDDQGNVTLVGAGTATITASFAGDDTYKAGEVAYTLTVSEPEVDAIRNLGSSSTLNAQLVKVYTLSGVFIGQYDSLTQAKAMLKRGVYVLRVNNTTQKLTVK